MKANSDLPKQRLAVLELAKTLQNVSDACRKSGITRTQFYKFKRRFEKYGPEGLKDLPPIHQSHPFTTKKHVVEKILLMSLENPAWGCVKLSKHLKLGGLSISSPTIQNILINNEMGNESKRLLKLEEKALQQNINLTSNQIFQIEKANPCFRERHASGTHPGELLIQDAYFVGQFWNYQKVFLHAVIDTYASYAFGLLSNVKVSESAAAAVLRNNVLPFYRNLGLVVETIQTDFGREFRGANNHPFELCLVKNDIQHLYNPVSGRQTNGFMVRFKRIIMKEFFKSALSNKENNTAQALQTDLDQWIVFHNNSRTFLGFPNMGKRPIDMIHDYLNENM